MADGSVLGTWLPKKHLRRLGEAICENKKQCLSISAVVKGRQVERGNEMGNGDRGRNGDVYLDHQETSKVTNWGFL